MEMGGGVSFFVFSSAVPPGRGAFQMPTRPSVSASAVSTLRGGRANLRNASVTFSLFSSAVPPGSGAFQMSTRPSSSSSASAASASTLRGGGKSQSQKRFSNFFSFFA